MHMHIKKIRHSKLPITLESSDPLTYDMLYTCLLYTSPSPRDNHLLDQVCYYHGGESGWGGESIKLIITNQDSTGNGDKQYIIRRVYPHVIEWKDAYAY